MIDTLQIQPLDFDISPDTRLQVQPAPYVAGTGETLREHVLWSNGNGEIRGEKAYLNMEGFQVDVKSKGGVSLLLVKLSVSKYLNGNNFYSVNREQVELVLSALERELSDFGIRFNVAEAKLSRLDMFKNVQTSQPFLSYSPLFAHMKAKRQKTRDYGTSFLWHNTQQQTMIYDKIEEMKHHKIDASNYPPNIARIEHRLLKGRKIKSVLGMERARELVLNYDDLGDYFRETLKGNLFRYDVGEIQYMTEDKLMAELTYFVDSYGNKGLNKFIMAKGVESLYKTVNPEVFRKVLRDVLSKNLGKDSVRKKIGRADVEMERVLTDLEMIGVDAESLKPISELYLELMNKILA